MKNVVVGGIVEAALVVGSVAAIIASGGSAAPAILGVLLVTIVIEGATYAKTEKSISECIGNLNVKREYAK